MSVLLGNGDGSFRAGRTFTAGTGPSSVAAANLGNGHVDIVTADSGSNTADMLAGFCAEARKYLATSRQHVANLPRNMRVAYGSLE